MRLSSAPCRDVSVLMIDSTFSARPMASQCLQEVWLQTGMVGSKQGWRVLDMSRLKSHLERTSV